jgi:hypothetical protein
MIRRCWLTVMLCSTVVMVVVVAAAQAASASAALPEFSKTGLSVSVESASASLETTSGLKIKCGTSTGSGEVTGAKAIGGYKQSYMSCALEGGSKCSSSGAATGEVRTEPLSGEIGYIKAPGSVGLRFESSKGKGFVLAEPSCGGIKIPIKGAVIGIIGPVNIETTKFELIQKGTEGVQAIKKFEGLEEEVLTVGTVHCDLNSNSRVVMSAALSIVA